MGRLGAVRQKRNPQATELSQLKEELWRLSDKLESREGELAEALLPADVLNGRIRYQVTVARAKSPAQLTREENHA